MAIKGLTDQQAAFPQIGILRKGAEKPEKGDRPGADLTYFRFTSDDDSALTAFKAAYGPEPRDINVYLPYPSMDENLGSFQEHWVAGGLKHRCDGETCLVWQNSDGAYITTPKPCPGSCKAVGRLAVVIPELKRLAFVTVLTTSLHDIMTLTQNLRALELMRGDLRGIPLVLRRRPRKVSTPRAKGPRVRQEKWLLTLEAAPQWVELQLAAQHAAALPQLPSGELPDLVAPEDFNSVTVDAETGEILDTGNGPSYDDSPPGWFDDTPPEEPAPKPESSQEGAKPANGEEGIVSTQDRINDLLAAVNGKTGNHYKHAKHLFNALQDGDDSFDWPHPSERDRWNALYTRAVKRVEDSGTEEQGELAEFFEDK